MTGLIAASFAALIVLAFANLVYQSAIAPSVRLRLRYQLFRLRDDLRQARRKESGGRDERVFGDFERGINLTIKYLAAIDVPLLFRMKRVCEADRSLQEHIDHSAEIFEAKSSERLKDLRRRHTVLILKLVLTNSLGLLLLLLPMSLAIALLSSLKPRAQGLLQGLLWISETEMARVALRPVS